MGNNKISGNIFEQELCKELSRLGFWAHNMANRKNGQPADVIAVRNGKAYLIDCKDCDNDIFQLSRVEANQECAMDLWTKKGNGEGLFALNTSEGVYMMPYSTIVNVASETSRLKLETIKMLAPTLREWNKRCL